MLVNSGQDSNVHTKYLRRFGGTVTCSVLVFGVSWQVIVSVVYANGARYLKNHQEFLSSRLS